MRFSAQVVAAISAISALSGTFAAPAANTELAKRQTYTGDVTHYEVGLGACGWWNGNWEWVAALSHEYFDTFPGYNGGNPNNNPVCGRQASVFNPANGKTITVGLVDRCEACKYSDLDLSPSAFQALVGDLGIGRKSGIQWHLI